MDVLLYLCRNVDAEQGGEESVAAGAQAVVVNQFYSITDKLYHFFNAPVIIFMYNVVRHTTSHMVAFLCPVYGFVCLFDLKPHIFRDGMPRSRSSFRVKFIGQITDFNIGHIF